MRLYACVICGRYVHVCAVFVAMGTYSLLWVFSVAAVMFCVHEIQHNRVCILLVVWWCFSWLPQLRTVIRTVRVYGAPIRAVV